MYPYPIIKQKKNFLAVNLMKQSLQYNMIERYKNFIGTPTKGYQLERELKKLKENLFASKEFFKNFIGTPIGFEAAGQ